MFEKFYTVEEISKMLSIHAKTIQKYIREGKLRATKLGKSWRISGHDLSIFMENNSTLSTDLSECKSKQIRTTASSVIDIEMQSEDDAIRISNSLSAAMNILPSEYGKASMQSQYLKSESKVRITLWGNIKFMSAILAAIDAFTDQQMEELQ